MPKNRFGSWDEIEKIIQPNTMLFMSEFIEIMRETANLPDRYKILDTDDIIAEIREECYLLLEEEV